MRLPASARGHRSARDTGPGRDHSPGPSARGSPSLPRRLKDLQLGGHSSDPLVLGTFSLLAAIGLALRLRQLRMRQADLKDAP